MVPKTMVPKKGQMEVAFSWLEPRSIARTANYLINMRATWHQPDTGRYYHSLMRKKLFSFPAVSAVLPHDLVQRVMDHIDSKLKEALHSELSFFHHRWDMFRVDLRPWPGQVVKGKPFPKSRTRWKGKKSL